ncbi:hypothetical protein GE09DRAFT_59944 [Coniochaeta sp. 2T2.1]|nr:hypothetical protein GE09DRAFT_59944 [Coniochaeta sp. 2T2.1]
MRPETTPSNNIPDPKQTPGSSLDSAIDVGSQDEGKPKQAPAKRRRRAKAEPDQAVDEEKPRAKKRAKAAPGGNIAKAFGSVVGDNPVAGPDTTEKAVEVTGKGKEEEAPAEKITSPKPLSRTAPSALNTDNATKSTKMLKFNPKTGTIGSPPPPKAKASKTAPETEAPEDTSPAETGTRRSSRPVSVQYGGDDASRKRIGEKVNTILKSPPKSKAPRTPRKKKAPATDSSSPGSRIKKSPPNIEHPFFAKGKAGKASSSTAEAALSNAPQPPKPKRDTIQTSTPISPKKSRTSLGNCNAKAIPQFNVKSAGLKFPGQKAPAWPWKDMVHVRGNSPELEHLDQRSSHSIPFRKSKGRAVQLSVQDSLIDMVTQRMNVPAHAEAVRNANSDDFVPPPPELRLPTKHFESGNKLQLRVFPELKCSAKLLPNGNARGSKKSITKDALADDHRIALHPPQLVRFFNSVRTSLSAFDRADCDNVSWAQKYAPTCAAEIIQPGKEAFFLKEWLQALVVQSVDTGSGPSDEKPGKDKGLKKGDGEAPKKKSKKRKKLDDFIVSSDEEASILDEVSDNDNDWTPSGKFGIVKKTVIRSGDRRAKESKGPSRLTNALVISGPHGCGKTAAVYAVAKELDFEVFEINSSSRRSGKDVDDKIGNMLKHHHVSHDNAKPAVKDGDAEAQKAADDLAKEIASGKQKTMASFFTKKAAPAKPKQPAKPPSAANTKPPPPKEVKKDPPKGQKQSLILLDEVDILYDEDKQFWARVVELIVKSKRPFIMTCNDETIVPLHMLNLHGIFRLSAPPTDLAVDRLLLIAANEGHALRREPVEALFVARNHDLRAATMELNYWCQIGVGDRRGGVDWFYPRWPKGIDLDDNKEVVRVVSEDTYQLGMGWLGRDMVVDKQTPVEEEILQQCWDLWNLDAGHWQDSTQFSLWAEVISKVTAGDGQVRLNVLNMYDSFADAMSAADICSSTSFAQFQEELIDPTKTELCSRSADDYIIGLPLLDAPPVIRYDRMSTMLPIALKSTAKAMLHSLTTKEGTESASPLRPLDENMATDMIRNHFTRPVDAPALARIDFAVAFDPIAASEKVTALTYLDPSVFDRNMEPITLDVAPYVRSIVAYDQNLQQQRLRLSNLISEGGGNRGPKRMRTTRAAYSAMEGGSRTTTRGDKWFKADLNPYLVMKTAGTGWTDLVMDNGSATLGNEPSPEKEKETAVECSPGSVTMQESPTPKKPLAKRGKGRPRKMVTVVRDESDDELA